MTLIQGLGALLKYELHSIGHKDAAVLVSLTASEWADLQKSATDAPASELKDIATTAIAAAHVVPQANGKVAVQLQAGDYAKVSEAHAAVAHEEKAVEKSEKGEATPESKAEA
jgi:hypothetical protein